MSSVPADRDLSAPFLTITLNATINELLALLPKEREQRKRFYLVYPVGDGFAALRWSELETLAASLGTPVDRTKPLSTLAGLPAAPNTIVNPTNVGELSFAQPVLVVVGSTVVALLADDTRAARGPERDPFRSSGGVLGMGGPSQVAREAADPSAPREVNAWLEGYDGTQPLAVNNVYQLNFDVSAARARRLLVPPENRILAKDLFKQGQQQIELNITIEGGSDFAVWGTNEEKLVVPRDSNSKGFASFNIEPLKEGICQLDAYIFLGDNLLQQWTFSFQAGPYQAGSPVMDIKAKGFTLDSASKLNAVRSPNTVNFVINPIAGGYSSLVINGVRTSVKLGLTDEALDELLKESRNALRGIVYTDQWGAAPYTRGLDIPPAVHQQALNKLAETGALLYNTLFYGPGTDDLTAKLGDMLKEYSARGTLRIKISAENFIFPWTMLYYKDLDGDADWEGFWGFRHIVEYTPLASATTISFDPQIAVSGKLPLLFIANAHIDEQMQAPLIAGQQEFFATLSDQIDLTMRTTKAEFLQDLNNTALPAQVIYLYCHAESNLPGEGAGTIDSRLLIDDLSEANALKVRDLTVRANPRNKLAGAPLVYMNACQGAEMSTKLYSGLVPYLIQKGARGVIGTEVDTPALFAAEFAKRFFARFIVGDVALGQLMLELRREYVQKHNNLMGLVYSLYSNGEVQVVRN